MRCRVSLWKYPQPFHCTLHFVKTFFRLVLKSIQGNCFIYHVKFTGFNFPANGPILPKKTQGWEPNTERLFARDGMPIGNNFKWLWSWKEVVIICVTSKLLTSKIWKLSFRAPNDLTNLKGTIWSLINKRDKFSLGFKMIMNRKRPEISQCFIRREELVQIKIEFRLLFCPNFWFIYICKPHVIKLCVIQLLSPIRFSRTS